MFLFNRHPDENPNDQLKKWPETISEEERLKMREELEKEFEEAGIKIEQPRHFLDLPINSEVFDEKFRDSLKKYCNEFWHYLKLPFVWDNFGNDYKAREVWRRNIEDKYGKTFPKKIAPLINNKLCKNEASALILAIGLIKKQLKKLNDKQYENLIEIFETAENETDNIALKYTSIDIGEKRLEINKIEDIVYNILKAISEFSQK